jgi:hypothetical protein
MPDPSRPRKSRSKASKGDGSIGADASAAQPIADNNAEVEIAPEGIAPDPALFLTPGKATPGAIAIKKRAPVPGRLPKPASIDTIPPITEEPAHTFTDSPVQPAPVTIETTPSEPDVALLPTRHPKKDIKPKESVVAEEAAVAEADIEAPAEPPAIIAPAQEAEPGPLEEPGPTRGAGLWAALAKLRARWGWALGLAALGVAILGQKLAMDARVAGLPDPPALSWVLFGVAGALFVLGIPPWPPMLTQHTTLFLATLRSMSRRRRWLFYVLFWGGVLLGLTSLPLFWTLNTNLPEADINTGWLTNTGSWLLWIAALLLFATAWVLWERSVGAPTVDDRRWTVDDREQTDAASNATVHRLPSTVLPTRWHWTIMAALFLLAVLLRFPNLENAPPGLWFDEAEEGLLAQQLLEPEAVHHTFIGGFYTMGTIYLYILGIIIKLSGAGIWELRLLPAIGGSLMVPMLYVLGTRLYNWRVGLLAGGLLATSAWHINWSRIGVNPMPTFALDLAVYLCVMQGLRTGRLGYYAGAGVLIGLALQTYLASQVVPAVLVVLFAYRLITERMRFFRAVRAGIAVFVVSALLTFIPLGTFAVQHPETFTLRASAVTIFSSTGSEGRPDALAESIRRHLYMFNFRGDSNPRHNLPGEPMLDWLTASLFLAGLAACVLRIWRWQYLFPVVWFGASLSGGVLSLVFEAPQSLRTMENSVVSALVASIFLGAVWAALDARLPAALAWWRNRSKERAAPARAPRFRGNLASVPHLAVAAAVLLMPLWSGFANTDKYFKRQMNDMSVWLEMWGTNRALGELLASFSDEYRVYISPDRTSTPTSRYLAPNKKPEVWPGGHILPFVEEQKVAVLLGLTDEADVLVIKRLYPNAEVNMVYGPRGEDPQLYNIVISPEDIRSLRGAQVIDEAHSAATLKIDQYAPYKFGWDSTAGQAPQVMLDGAQVLMGAEIFLGAGLHSVVLSGTQGTKADFTRLLMAKEEEPMGPISSALLFDPRKVEPHGLTAYLRDENTFEGEPDLVRIDSQVSFYFHVIPFNRPYTVEWVGKLYAPVGGSYAFHTEQLSVSRLFIDGAEVLANSQPNVLQSATVVLTEGLHDIRLQYQDLDGFSHMYLYWTPPTLAEKFIIPVDFLLPALARYPEVPASGRWPTLDETDDTKWKLANQPAVVIEPQPTPVPEQDATKEGVVEPTAQPPATSQPPPTPAFTGDRLAPSVVLGIVDTPALPRPRAAAVDAEGNLYVYTEEDSKIRKFNEDGAQVTAWDVIGTDDQPVKEGSAMLVREGKLLFLDSAPSQIIVYGLDGTVEKRISACTCYFPRGMAPSNDGNLWVTDTGFSHIFKVSLAGETLASMGERGTGPGQFIEPSSVWESPQGYLFVADAGNRRVQSFTPQGQPLAQWGMGEGTARDGNRLTGTPEGNVLLTQYDGRAVIEYDPEGHEQARWVYEPSGRTLIPSGIAPAGDGKYLVLYPFDNAAALFALGR